MMCGALILAAGASARLGQPKQLVRFGGETLLDRAIRIATEAGCAPVVVVLGAFEDMIRAQCELKDVSTVSNADWMEGMGTSLAQGVHELANAAGILVMTCDMPAVTVDHLRNLAGSMRMMASSYAGRKGVPAYFPNDFTPELAKLKGDVGARELLRLADAIELLGGDLDVDTFEDLARARTLFG